MTDAPTGAYLCAFFARRRQSRRRVAAARRLAVWSADRSHTAVIYFFPYWRSCTSAPRHFPFGSASPLRAGPRYAPSVPKRTASATPIASTTRVATLMAAICAGDGTRGVG